MRGSGALDVDRAVMSAKEAQPMWGSLTGLERGKIMARAGRIIKVYLKVILMLSLAFINFTSVHGTKTLFIHTYS